MEVDRSVAMDRRSGELEEEEEGINGILRNIPHRELRTERKCGRERERTGVGETPPGGIIRIMRRVRGRTSSSSSNNNSIPHLEVVGITNNNKVDPISIITTTTINMDTTMDRHHLNNNITREDHSNNNNSSPKDRHHINSKRRG